MPPYPYFRALYAVPVRQVRGLLTASFRFRLTADTLAVRLCASSLPMCTRDFHPLELAHARQTKKALRFYCPQGFFPDLLFALFCVNCVSCSVYLAFILFHVHSALYSPCFACIHPALDSPCSTYIRLALDLPCSAYIHAASDSPFSSPSSQYALTCYFTHLHLSAPSPQTVFSSHKNTPRQGL